MILGGKQSRRQAHPKRPIALAAILAVVLVCAAAFAVYVSIYYHGEPAAVQAMTSGDTISVYELRDGVIVFAPMAYWIWKNTSSTAPTSQQAHQKW